MITASLRKLVNHYELKKVKPFWILFTGILLMGLAHLSWNIDILGWVAMVPFLIYLNVTKGWRSRVMFTLTLIISWSLIILKIISHPIPYTFIPLFSLPIAMIHLPGYLIYDSFRNSRWSVLIFPACMTVLEWFQYSFTPLGSWGVAAYTQVDSIYMAQSLSLFGLAGLSFLVYWINASVTELILKKKAKDLNFFIPLIILFLMLLFGYLRCDLSKIKGHKMITVAAIGTDSEVSGLPLPSDQSNQETIRAIFRRTKAAANAGVKIAVWTEAAFFLTPKNESEWKDSISELAGKNNLAIVASYVVPVTESPLTYENKFVFYAPDGSILQEYLKHEPVPGEPAIKGTEPITTKEIFNCNIGGAICYDYDFPRMAQRNQKAGADIIVLPSSDWRGIDPLHSKMAAFRAIEQGQSIIRSTRFGLSAAISPYGELVSRMSSFDENNQIMIADLPVKGIKTIYSYIGDIPVYLSICLLLYIIIGPEYKKLKMLFQKNF